ncbi:hypothetical protein [Streptosporangium amethystogenes]|uniref:hypothetical protein n=1 Tax=Streptosporangium amethystogenes TaxID=2002 RepID=UPI0012FC5FCE|nr:hypothetical protein [Streptosporangium amethystogenes]
MLTHATRPGHPEELLTGPAFSAGLRRVEHRLNRPSFAAEGEHLLAIDASFPGSLMTHRCCAGYGGNLTLPSSSLPRCSSLV